MQHPLDCPGAGGDIVEVGSMDLGDPITFTGDIDIETDGNLVYCPPNLFDRWDATGHLRVTGNNNTVHGPTCHGGVLLHGASGNHVLVHGGGGSTRVDTGIKVTGNSSTNTISGGASGCYTGLSLEDGAEYNHVDLRGDNESHGYERFYTISDCIVGAVVRGGNTQFNSGYVAVNDDIATCTIGAIIDGGTRHNTLTVQAHATQFEGVIIDEAGTDANSVHAFITGTGSHGVHITGGARGNMLAGTVEGAGGNGVLIEGAGTS